MDEQKRYAKPLVLEMEEAEKETVEAVNGIMAKHNLPCYFFEGIFDKIHKQLIDGKKNEIAAASAQYEAQKATESKEE